MVEPESNVASHYTVADLGERILTALRESGTDVDALTVDDLAPVDAFHLCGRPATEQLARWADIRPDHLVLDAGCGIGGTSRYLAATTGCTVVGVDLTEAYCRVAEMLSARVGLRERATFRQGSVLDLPFDDAHFDVVWTEHVQMNIGDKAGFYGELRRVLRPGGQLAFHDIFAGAGADALHLPVPWAGDPSISHLIDVDELSGLLGKLGFETVRWDETTAESIDFVRTALDRARLEGPGPVGLHLIMDDAPSKLGNVLRNLEQGRLRVVQAVLR